VCWRRSCCSVSFIAETRESHGHVRCVDEEISEDERNFYIRVAVPRDAVTEHLPVFEAVLKGLSALLIVHADPIDLTSERSTANSRGGLRAAPDRKDPTTLCWGWECSVPPQPPAPRCWWWCVSLN
jgi:hypothetical protein